MKTDQLLLHSQIAEVHGKPYRLAPPVWSCSAIEADKYEEETNDKKHHRIERVYGSFLRRFTLPENVDENSIRANFKDGILSLTLTKAEPAEPKAIEVDVQ